MCAGRLWVSWYGELTAGCTSLGLGCAEEEPCTCLAFAELELLLLAGEGGTD